MEILIPTNKYQTPITKELLANYPQEVQDQFLDFVHNVPYIRNLISPNRPYAKDCPKDEEGKIIIDFTNPPILTDMDYFRPVALKYQKDKRISDLRPNPNPNSEYGKWIREEVRRCYEGYVRAEDGMWIDGDTYFFWNYCPIMLSKTTKGSRKAMREEDFPEVWEGHWLKFHYSNLARLQGHHGAELASRGKGKSFSLGARIAKRFILGEDRNTNKNVKCLVTAYQKEYLNKDGILNKFVSYADFAALHTQFPSKRLKSSMSDMHWKMGYIDLDTLAERGSLNEVIGVSSKDDESKLRGKRGVLIAIEEFGSFPNLLNLYGTLRPSVEEGDYVFGQIYCQGTAGDSNSDFASAQEIMYNPKGYNMQSIPNVYDKDGCGRKDFVYFFPGFMNKKGCYNEDGVSDVVKALLDILMNRYTVKYNSTDLNAITKTISEVPITPQEAILRTKGNIFPVNELTQRLTEIDNNPNFYDDTYVGTLFFNASGEVEFKPTPDTPIREFPTKDNKVAGALEIYSLPQEVNGKIPQDRYIIGLDNYENDTSNTMSLGSFFVFDMWRDEIVAEYTGRPTFIDDLNELVRMACLYYNAKCLYENNKKNTYAHFSKHNSLYLLEETPEYLRQRELTKAGYGNTAYGVCASVPIKKEGFTLIRNWLLKPRTIIQKIDNENKEVTVPTLYTIKNRALLKELILFNPDINVDRIMALIQVMLFREQLLVTYQNEIGEDTQIPSESYLGNDEFFKENYQENDVYI